VAERRVFDPRRLGGGPADGEAIVDQTVELYRAYHSRNIEQVSDLYTVDGWHREVASGRTARGREAIGEGLRRFLRSFPDAYWEAEVRIVEKDREAVPYRLTGTLAEPLGGFLGRGQRLDLRGVHIISYVGDRIRSSEDYWDVETFRRQMQAE
jgi:steroid delta-isomerase-like uncharacterized protein